MSHPTPNRTGASCIGVDERPLFENMSWRSEHPELTKIAAPPPAYRLIGNPPFLLSGEFEFILQRQKRDVKRLRKRHSRHSVVVNILINLLGQSDRGNFRGISERRQ
jgi:hypothetical protein